jgi:hypothetical protein
MASGPTAERIMVELSIVAAHADLAMLVDERVGQGSVCYGGPKRLTALLL